MRPRDLLESDCLLHNPLTETKMREACEIGVSKRSFRIIHVLSRKMFFFFFFFSAFSGPLKGGIANNAQPVQTSTNNVHDWCPQCSRSP